MSQLSFPHSNISRLRIGFTRNGTRVERNFRNDGNTTLVEVEPTASGCISGIETPDGTSDSHDPTIVVTIKDLSALVTAARDAEFSLKRFLELNDPRGIDLKHLERLQAALAQITALPQIP